MIVGKNSRGVKVRKLQYRLGIGVDGIFGSGTESHVKEWQRNHNLEPDGTMKDVDWNMMFGCNVDDWTPMGIVVHSMSEFINVDGEWIGAREFLETQNLSVHGFIKPNGNVITMKKTNEKAAHAGTSKHNGLSGLNSYFLGYELLVKGHNTYGDFIAKIKQDNCYTSDQFNRAVMLTNIWMEEYKIPKKDVVRHSDVSGDDVRGAGKGKKDPGVGFDWEKFKSELI